MALAPGARLGPYEIDARIGAGGMGEVYRAKDTNLKRTSGSAHGPRWVDPVFHRQQRRFARFIVRRTSHSRD
jgi:serine/threonine protein kinase